MSRKELTKFKVNYIKKNKPLNTITIIPIINIGIAAMNRTPTPSAAKGINKGVNTTNNTIPKSPKNTFNRTKPTLKASANKIKNMTIPNNVENILSPTFLILVLI